jgi:hypothetical protein
VLLEKKKKKVSFNLYNFFFPLSKRFSVCFEFNILFLDCPPVQNISKIKFDSVCTVFVPSKHFSVYFDFNILFLERPSVQTISKIRFDSVCTFFFFFSLQMFFSLISILFQIK